MTHFDSGLHCSIQESGIHALPTFGMNLGESFTRGSLIFDLSFFTLIRPCKYKPCLSASGLFFNIATKPQVCFESNTLTCSYTVRGVIPELNFGRSVNPISTRVGRLCPHITSRHPRFSDLPPSLHLGTGNTE